MKSVMILFLFLSFSLSAQAETTCFGEGAYRVCTTTKIDENGNMSITSTDSMGNNYSVNSQSYTTPDGRSVVRSWDSMGNDYKVESWSDSSGVHSVDSEGNSYSLDTRNYTIPDVHSGIRSRDGIGDDYKIKSRSGSSGIRSTDSEGDIDSWSGSGGIDSTNSLNSYGGLDSGDALYPVAEARSSAPPWRPSSSQSAHAEAAEVVAWSVIGGVIVWQVLGLIVAGIVGVLIGKDASARGMSGVGWGLFTFFLCIIALPIYVIVRKPRTNEN